ncbi:MAG: F420-dependent oxidoreductase, partial [Nocardioides sp.]|nr:F420-dependent oxidoreductase [Nocardioides sp.]
PAVADEIAGVAELAQGKLGGRPVALVRGRADLVLAPDDHGPGARALVRAEGADLFGFGAREAVVRAVAGDPADRHVFGGAAPSDELLASLHAVGADATAYDGGVAVSGGRSVEVLMVLAFAHGWVVDETIDPAAVTVRLRLRPATP